MQVFYLPIGQIAVIKVMTEHVYHIALEEERHQGGVRALLARAFGPGRMMRAIYRLRDGVPPDPGLCFVMVNRHDLVLGVVRNYRVRIGDNSKPALLLGPIAVAQSHEKLGLAARLIRHTVEEATAQALTMIYLVGDPNYYGEFGFTATNAAQVKIEGLEEGKLVLGLELVKGAALDFAGVMRNDDSVLLNQLQGWR